jgi:hypothetical protein
MITVIALMSHRPLFKLRAEYPLLAEIMEAAIDECILAVHVLPEDILADREKLTDCLTEQLHGLGHRKAAELEARWQAARQKQMGGNEVANRPDIPD